ncbi:serine/threonine-protein kinase/endoribonuclease IRE1-like isoform X1 [Daphnia pulicaria]|uniref:serine/threonine-protein kinase/endoribonuclease IRE1-like isoform X1 n=1 Tax=Daphnia pulicaria TaxID=35523 RepID=UPI001EE9E25C|nr:serine/threonine-protein kinase/endoribonuclease IRE1-like isoform X1 [Daphnia pulicaria]XP_046634002.1 serine/threonine-protein kinase/endoribonuclease IRE1-like isoform X1 [Daphnia pulicaria]XP_046634003.1 serine/threonine-protein kinase/endoribonuclease IRE1-like isoform X1 [Daphnia pulicaria]
MVGRISFDGAKLLGNGQFSNIYSGMLDGVKQVAVKQVLLEDVQRNLRYHCIDESDIYKQRNQREENALMKILDHRNVIKLFLVEEDAPFKNFALELCLCSLYQYCKGQFINCPMPSDATVLLDIAEGLLYVHSKGLAHRNIDPKNILISSTHPVTVMLADFGLSKPVRIGTNSFSVSRDRQNAQGNNLCWMAPELLDHPDDEAFSEKRGSVASDIFSTGCVFFFYLKPGCHPFGNGSISTVKNISEGNPVNFNSFPEEQGRFKTMVKSMIASKPEDRIRLNEVVNQLKEIKSAEEEDDRYNERLDWLN